MKGRRILPLFTLAFISMAVSSGAAAQTVVEYLHLDAAGTPVAVTDAGGVIVESSDYDPYGSLINRAPTDGPGFNGHVNDVATGLTYMQQRYLDPDIGRMVSTDPVTAYQSGDLRYFNRYAFAFNNPFRYVDPDGRAVACPDDSNCDLTPRELITTNEETVTVIGTMDDTSAVVAERGNNALAQLDATLTAHDLFAPTQVGDLVRNDSGVFRWEGATRQEVKNARRVSKLGSLVSWIGIGTDSVVLYQAIKTGDNLEIAQASLDVGMDLFGMTGFGTIPALAYDGTQLLLQNDTIYKYTVTPLANGLCAATGDC
jgi:RHS repeat-associated protein